MIGGIILIALGVVFLLNNLGVLPWDIWNALWRLWPLALIAIGLDFLIGRDSRYRTPLLVGTLVVGGALVLWWTANPPANLRGTTEEISQGLEGASSARVEIGSGVTRLRIEALSDSNNLIEGRVRLLGGEELERSARKEGDTLVYVLRSRGRVSGFNNPPDNEGWNLNLNPSIPIDLRVNTGVGESNLDLSGLRLSRLDVNSGVGATRIELPGSGQFDAKVNGGVGEIRVNIPRAMGVRLVAKAGLGRVDVPRGLLTIGENTYESEGYAGAQNRVNLTDIDGGIGQIVVRQD